MKFLIFTAVLLIGANSSPVLQKEHPYQRFIEFPDDNGVLHLIDLENTDLQPHAFDPETDIKYILYNRENKDKPVEIFIGDEESLSAAKFDSSKPVKFTIHGWTGSGSSSVNKLLVEAFLNAMDVTVIVVDWGIGARADYITAVRYVPLVGAKVGKLMDWLNTLGVDFSDYHVLGHSLGGHVAGISGRSTTRGQVEYISGLDPAFPLWGSDSQRIRSSDGKYVEIIHTNGNNLGLMEPVGHTDFYPNGGVHMTGCGGSLDTSCHHGRSYRYMADSIDHKGFVADRCESVDEIKENTCSNLGKLHMGGASIKEGAEGVYYLETNAEKPYYMG